MLNDLQMLCKYEHKYKWQLYSLKTELQEWADSTLTPGFLGCCAHRPVLQVPQFSKSLHFRADKKLLRTQVALTSKWVIGYDASANLVHL